ncbi:amidase [Paenibacillus sp. CGMCC 1.16610]|uniref:Amidase n=1 Tax=Paenibacillus anseongense TaxID=2682845 RepID=A0ABW9UH52_9BACL|nr:MULTISPECIES: amidase [Paenibacillus]MBA2939852.1 amidase [Paenibacillus sp. CGMCC 1.16610]MVQ39512.1 amidase [Paenibacillus anseongense]
MKTTNFTYKSATELAKDMAAGKVSSVELTQAAIDRINDFDEKVNAICVPDFEEALAVARKADAIRARGDERPLLGIPMTVKESFNIAGLPTTWGIPHFKDFVAAEDAVAVARLKAAGAVILGKTNVPLGLGDLQSYNDVYGTTNNPWDLSRTPGGSSGGSAAALAAGYGALSIGSDIAGSLRGPAHYCGVYAHKPTLGLLPSRGHSAPPARPLAFEQDLSVIGPMARSATDLSLLLDILSIPEERSLGIAYKLVLPPARHDSLVNYRVLILDTHPLIPSDLSVQESINRLADQLTKVGTKVVRHSSLLPDQTEAARLYMRLLLSTFSANYPAEVYEYFQNEAKKLDATDLSLAAERTRGSALSHRDWLAANYARAELRQRWSELFVEFDVVLCPAMPTVAFQHDHKPDIWHRQIMINEVNYDYPDQLVWAGIATIPGLPATVAPIGHSNENLPIGIQIVGPLYEDRTTIRFAELLEREFGGFVPPTFV